MQNGGMRVSFHKLVNADGVVLILLQRVQMVIITALLLMQSVLD